MKNSLVRIIASVLILAFVGLASGCYGSFSLVTKVYKWNGTFGDKWFNELGFLVLNIIPVYSVSAFLDAVIFNTIQFWTGSNPIADNTPVTLDNQTTMTLNQPTGEMKLVQDGKTYVFAKSDDGVTVKDAEGRFILRCVSQTDGSVKLFNEDGSLYANCDAQQVAMLASVAR